MITIYVEDFNGEISQKKYSDILDTIDLNTLPCSSCFHYGMKIHGYYFRHILTSAGKISIRILRVRCPHCHKTHAVLLSLFVPYSSVELKDHLKILKDEDVKQLMEEKPDIDENTINRIRRSYRRFFKERMISYGISFDDLLIQNCFSFLRRNFDQIHCGYNVLYIQNHTGRLAVSSFG